MALFQPEKFFGRGNESFHRLVRYFSMADTTISLAPSLESSGRSIGIKIIEIDSYERIFEGDGDGRARSCPGRFKGRLQGGSVRAFSVEMNLLLFFFLFAIIEPPFSSQNRPLKIVGLCNRTHQPMNYTNNSPRRSGIVNGNGYSNHPPTIIETAFSVAINAPPFLSLSFSLSLFRPTESGPLFLFSISRAGQGRGNL